METTERIVEAYCRYIKEWFTLPNIRCPGQHEVDLLAVDLREPGEPKRYHIECGVSISGAFSKLTAKPYSTERRQQRVHAPEQRRTIDFFIQHKFNPEAVQEALLRHGFKRGCYERIIVSWGWTSEAGDRASNEGIVLWDFRSIIREVGESFSRKRSYFTDDTLRTLQLFVRASAERVE